MYLCLRRFIVERGKIGIYRLKNGRKVYRSFTVPYDIDPEYMDAVIGSDQYKESFFGLDKEGEYVANAGDVTATYDNGHGNLATDEFNYDDFKAAYEEAFYFN